jgi:uncharacterized protein (DUF488 family)
MDLYTIGHSKHPIEKFIQLLKEHQMEFLLDVRSTPYNRFNPQFNKNALQHALREQYIEYVYAGENLGGRPKDPSCYRHHAIPGNAGDYLHEVNYPEVMRRPWFITGIQQLLEIARQHITTIICSEENPVKCHRHHLIARYLMEAYPVVTILHIRADGSVIDAESIPSMLDQSDAEQLSF